MRRWMMVLGLALALAACTGAAPATAPAAAQEEPGNTVTAVSTGIDQVVFRVVDDDAGVVCWLYSGISKGGISCLPKSSTRLP